MARGSYAQEKRQRAAEKARKKREKAERRALKREQGPGEEEIATVEDVVGDLPSPEEALRNMQENAAAPRRAAAIPCRLFVGGLSWDTTEADLAKTFEQYGEIAEAVIPTDRTTGKSRGFAFVAMKNRKDAARAVEELDGTTLHGRSIVVNVATAR